MKIIADSHIPFLKGRLEPLARIEYIEPSEFVPERVKDADALLIRTRTRCDAPLLEGSHVRLIATATIGMDQFNLPWCRSHGIECLNSPGCNAPGVAQYVWSSLLRLGMEPGRHRVGVVGYGNVGSIVAEWGARMGFEILVNDPPKAAISPDGELHPAYGREVPLDELLRLSDAVTLHTPLTRDGNHPSYHLISESETALMKPGAVLVNAARGPVTDTQALIAARADKGLRLVIDTWEGEPQISEELLRRTDIASYHIAGYSLEGKQRATRAVVEHVCHFFGLGLPGLSDLATAYKPLAATMKPDEIRRAITDSFDPLEIMRQLRAAPGRFEPLREAYIYRPEPRFI